MVVAVLPYILGKMAVGLQINGVKNVHLNVNVDLLSFNLTYKTLNNKCFDKNTKMRINDV